MAEKHYSRRDIVAMAKGMDSEIPTEEDLAFISMEELKQEALDIEDSFRRAIGNTPSGYALVDSKRTVCKLDYDGIYLTTPCVSFRFDAGEGFFLDFSLMGPDAESVQHYAEMATKVLETIAPLVPRMMDGVEIEVDNFSFFGDTASDLFKFRPPGNTYSTVGPVHEFKGDVIREYKGMPVHRIIYHLTQQEFEYYAVESGKVHALFDHEPSEDDLVWASDIKPILDSLSMLTESSMITHFVLWRDDEVSPVQL